MQLWGGGGGGGSRGVRGAPGALYHMITSSHDIDYVRKYMYSLFLVFHAEEFPMSVPGECGKCDMI